MNRQKTFLSLAGLSSIVAMGFHLYLIWEYFQVKFGLGGNQPSLCQFSEKFDCAAVAASPFSNLMGIPLATFGFWTNLLFLILIVVYGVQKSFYGQTGVGVRFGLLLTSLALGLGSLVMGSISAVILTTYCLFCIITYVLSFTSIGFLAAATKNDLWVSKDLLSFKPLYLVIALIIPATSGFTHAIIMEQLGGKKLPIMIQESIAAWQSNPTQSFDVGLGITFGAPSHTAKYTLIEFVDLFCPHCKYASYPLKAFTKAHQDVSLIVKIFPLDRSCNPALAPEVTDGNWDGLQSPRCRWAYAILCAQQQNKGAEALTYVFEQQSSLAEKSSQFKEEIALMGEQLNLDSTSYQTCIESVETRNALVTMAKEGQTAEIQGTPVIFLNSRELPRGQLLPVLEGAILKAAQ